MPEGDVIKVAVTRLAQAFAQDEIILTDFRAPQCASADLAGARTLEVAPYGKNMLHRLDSGWTVHSHFRMDGRWSVHPTREVTDAQLRSRHARCVIATTQWTAIGYDLGRLAVMRTEDEHRLVTGRLGPDVLADGFDAAAASERLARPRHLGALLLDQTVVAGIGTIYASEALRACSVHPWLHGDQADPSTRDGVLHTARRLMLRTVEQVLARGWRAVTDKSTELPGGVDWRLVHGRSGQPCPTCGELVRVSGIGEGAYVRPMFYCATCQGGLAPDDPGGPVAPLGAFGGRGWN